MDEISRIRSVFGELHFRKLSTVQDRLLEEALEALRLNSGISWGVFRTGWGYFRRLRRTEANVDPAVTLILANGGGSRHGRREVVVVDEYRERFLIPYRNMADFFAFASMLEIESTYGYATLVNYLVPTLSGIGFEYKRPPEPLRDDEDARKFGFEFLDDYIPYTRGNNSFWQGHYAQCANYPFVLTLDTNHVPPFMNINFISPQPRSVQDPGDRIGPNQT